MADREDGGSGDNGDCTMNCVKVKSTGGLHHERGKTGKTQDQQRFA